MHGQQNIKDCTEMHGQQNIKDCTEMHGQQNIKEGVSHCFYSLVLHIAEYSLFRKMLKMNVTDLHEML